MQKKLILLASLLSVFILTGCNKSEVIKICHDRIYKDAKFTAEIVTTDTIRNGFDYGQVSGRAKLQNGFGAWTNYTYQCNFGGNTITRFKLQEGW